MFELWLGWDFNNYNLLSFLDGSDSSREFHTNQSDTSQAPEGRSGSEVTQDWIGLVEKQFLNLEQVAL